MLVYMVAVDLLPLQSEGQDTVWDCPAAPVFVLQGGRARARARETAEGAHASLPASGRTGATSPAGWPFPTRGTACLDKGCYAHTYTRGTACLDKSMYIPVRQAPGPVN